MNHIAFDIPADVSTKRSTSCTRRASRHRRVLNHDDSPTQVAREMHPGVFVRSIYFQDPDGILLEFAAWTKVFTEADVTSRPRAQRSWLRRRVTLACPSQGQFAVRRPLGPHLRAGVRRRASTPSPAATPLQRPLAVLR